MRTVFWFAIVFALLLALTLATLKYVVMPRVESKQADILQWVSQASGMAVTAKSIRGGWSGFTPFVELEEVQFREPANVKSTTRTPGTVALALPQLRAGVSIPYLLLGQVRLAELTLTAPALSLNRASDGLIYFAGRPLNAPTTEPDDGRLLQWLVNQPGISIQRATLTWDDALTPGSTVTLNDVGIEIEKRLRGHSFGFTATPPAALAKKIEASGRVNIRNEGQRWEVDGNVYVAANNANLSELRRHMSVPDAWQTGVGTARAWAEFDNHKTVVTTAKDASGDGRMAFINPVKSIVADVHIINAKAQLAPDVAPLNIAKLAGRLEYKSFDDGFTVGSKKLEFRTREGVNSPPADFSLTLHNIETPAKESGEITANGIDLKVMTSIIEYFPIGRDVREIAAKFGARGAVRETRFAWTGSIKKPVTYQIKGMLTDFGVNVNEKLPGFSGFSGTVDGNEKGGAFAVNAKTFVLDAPLVFRDTLRFDTVEGSGKWRLTDDEIMVDVANLGFANKDIGIAIAGQYSRLRDKPGQVIPPEKMPGVIDIKGTMTRTNATKIADYLPNGKTKTRDFIDWAVRDGVIESAEFLIKGQLYEFPFHQGTGGHFLAKAKLKNVDFRYAEGWPQANNIDAELILENTSMKTNIDAGKIFNARLQKTQIAVADFYAHPAWLTINGEADARGEDVSRYLRESPLIEGVGSFTKFMEIEGAGKLNLDLKIPLKEASSAASGTASDTANGAQPSVLPSTKLSGRYTLNRGTARLVVGPMINNLSGTVAFSETGVKSSGVQGIAYGNPLTVNIAGGGEAGVITDFLGRADIQQLGDIVPFAMPSQVTGSTDFAGRITGKASGVEIVVDSSMAGVTSTLPTPLGKRAEEARRLKLSFTNIGQASEKIRLTLLGNSERGATTDSPDSRIDARFQRKPDAAGIAHFYGGVATVGESATEGDIPEGLWLTGKMKLLEFDQWLNAFNNFASKTTESSVIINASTTTTAATAAAATAATAVAKAESPIAGFDFKLGQLIAYGRPFDDIKLKGRRATDVWAMSVSSREAEGDFTWRAAAFNERGAIRARLKKFVLTDEVPANVPMPAAPNDASANQANLPALDIVADDFTFKDRWLGKLELKATPQAANWKIDQLVISNGHAKVEMDGLWQRYGDPFTAPNKGSMKSLTTMNIKLASSNLNALFGQFGFGEQMKGGRGNLEGKLSWPGHTYQFQLNNLSGEFKVNAERGQFAKIQPGAGKLLGLISLQSIPRRLTLDFKDVLNEGLAFENIEGDLTITDGVMVAKKFNISGPAVDVTMKGEIVLPTERQNLSITVAPKLSTLAAVTTGALVNPVVGLGILLGGEVFKKPIERILSVQYNVTGTWENPIVESSNKTVVPEVPTQAPAPVLAPSPSFPPVPATKTVAADDNPKKKTP